MITPVNALKFSMWLAATHPQAFRAVLNQTLPPTAHRIRTSLAGVTFIPRTTRSIPRTHQRGQLGRLGDVYDDIDSGAYDAGALRAGADTFTDGGLQTFTPSFDYASDPALSEINVDIAPTSFDLTRAAASADDSGGGFWSALGSGLSSIGSGLESAVGTVAHAVLNPATLGAAGNLAATVIKAQGANAQTAAILQAQVTQTARGSAPHPITYATDPLTGQPTPILYNPNAGRYQPTLTAAPIAGALTPYVPYLLAGGGVLLVALLLRR